MPKFWAKDYLSEALQEQRAVVESMSLAPPAHIEIVDCYTHKGEVDNIHCTMPWIMFTPDPDFNLHSHVVPPESLLEPLLQTLGGGPPGGGHLGGLITGAGGSNPLMGLEKYTNEDSGSESLFSDDEETGTGASSSFGLTQEIDMAVDRVMSSLSGAGGRGTSGGCGVEDFPAENLKGWEKNTTPEMAELYLEDHESQLHLSSLLSSLPTATDLVARLKPKLISDPLVHPSTGRAYSYLHICRSDFELCEDNETLPREAPVIRDPITEARELDNFSREDVADGVAGDPILELCIASPVITGSLLEPPSPSLLPPLPTLPSPVLDEGDTENKPPIEELRELVSEVKQETERQQLHFTPPLLAQTPTSTSTNDFLQLNNADVSRDSEDSGIGHAVLESPCVPHFSSPSLLSSSSLPAHLARLQAFPVSPNSPHKLDLLSPESEDRLLSHLQEDSRTLDSVLALKLPYTGPGSYLNAILKSYRPLDLVEAFCDVRPINLSGDSELALPWDPLASCYRLMTAVQRALVCLQCPVDRDVAEVYDTAEKFTADASPGHGDEMGDGSIVEGDVPSMSSAKGPVGYLTNTRQVRVPSRAPSSDTNRQGPPLKSNGDTTKRSPALKSRRQIQQHLQGINSASSLELFIMMRTGKLSPEIAKISDTSNTSEVKGAEGTMELEDPMQHEEICVTSPAVQDVFLNREHQLIMGKVAHYGAPIVEALAAHGLAAARDTLVASLNPDDVKFFLKQQQKCLADSQGSKEEGVLLGSCKLAASLYVLVSLADGIIDINLATGLRRFAFLSEKYEELIGSCLDAAKQGLTDLQFELPHPKLHSLVSVVDIWKNSRRETQEKAVVVVGKDFSTVSGDILDFLKSISDLKSCVFSFACESPSNPLYLETLEERLQYYDCLVVPLSSIVAPFPWEKVGLLVEYSPLAEGALFPPGQLPPSLHLSRWVALNTCREVSPTSLTKSGSLLSVMAFQYTLIASENITNSPKLLQLLESRFNMVLISREYESLKKKIGQSFSHADLIVDQVTGVLVHPLSLLASDAGVHRVSTRATALSLQYRRLWILLYAEAEANYPYGGSVPLNLARLHASVAHYSSQDSSDYLVKVICVSDRMEAAQLVRTISEDTRKQNEGMNDQNWSDREWIADDMEMHERFLLGFPCLNSFSALLMLRARPLRQLLVLNLTQLQELFPWLPLKVAKFFSQMCHVCFQTNMPVMPPPQPTNTTTNASSDASMNHWQRSVEETHSYNEPTNTAVDLNDSLQYEESYSPNAVSDCTKDTEQQLLPPSFSATTSALWASEESNDLQPLTANRSTNSALQPYAETELIQESVSGFTGHPGLQQRLKNRELQACELATESHIQTSRNHTTTAGFVAPVRKGPSPPTHISLFEPTTPSPGGAESSPKLSEHHFTVSENLYREYYGNDPVPPRLLTSGMVRRTPHRQPIKSLDLDIGYPSQPPREGPRLQANDRVAAVGPHLLANDRVATESPRLQANDRVAALGPRLQANDRVAAVGPHLLANSRTINNGSRYSERIVSRGEGVLLAEGGPGEWARIQGVEDMMAFHSRQSSAGLDTRVQAALFTSHGATTNTQRFRQKRPLPRSPIFDCRVPTQTISPQSIGESSLFPSPDVSLGSVKLSPLRKRRLVYKKIPSSADGQTKLAFE